MSRPVKKKVYIFGAGASVAAKLPIQSNILNNIFTLQKPIITMPLGFIESFDEFSVMLISQYEFFEKSRRILTKFIIQTFGDIQLRQRFKDKFVSYDYDINRYDNTNIELNEKWNQFYIHLKDIDISLEDVFTLLDKASLSKEYFSLYSVADMDNIQESLNYCIVYSISNSIHISSHVELYDKIAEFLIRKRLKPGLEADTFSLITLNWDTVLDKYIYDKCKSNNLIHPEKQIFPDYCCYNYDINSEVPSIHIKAKGNYNIKLMKLHGSINWLVCSNCGRLYSDYARNISLQYSNKGEVKCKFCESSSREYKLRRLIITPTFIKAFNNLHLKNVWHNAYLDLCEADEIIFIGYSFPDADFELRYLLKKAIKPSAKIKVILHQKDNPKLYRSILKDIKPIADKNETFYRINLPYKRYISFFKNHKVEFCYKGIENALNDGWF
ncbi:MAG: hypothetical protein K0S75_833 [Clostridia bacterium]|jgi:NAD-dependent SIR2 family protein deacetylase|nr:hypothetical protein [Clostridia bacterium]